MPHKPPGWEREEPCWKLIAGVIELNKKEQILAEMQRVNWTIEQGRKYLIEHFHKQSRSQLIPKELEEFLTYLQAL